MLYFGLAVTIAACFFGLYFALRYMLDPEKWL